MISFFSLLHSLMPFMMPAHGGPVDFFSKSCGPDVRDRLWTGFFPPPLPLQIQNHLLQRAAFSPLGDIWLIPLFGGDRPFFFIFIVRG